MDNDVVWVFKREDGRWDWRRVDEDNKQTVSTSGNQGYEHEDECIAMARSLNPDIPVKHFPGGEE